MDGEFYAFTGRFTKHNEAQREPFRGGSVAVGKGIHY